MASQPKDKKLLLEESKTFCMMPWIHIQADPDGDVRPCCMAMEPIGSLKKNSLKELWNIRAMRKLRKDMLRGIPNPTCRRCYDKERVGAETLRLDSLRDYGQHFSIVEGTSSEGTLEEMNIKYLDIRFSNVCNFRCRTCSPKFSSNWHRDYTKMVPMLEQKGWNFAPFNDPPIIIPAQTEEDLWKQIEPLIPSLESIYFAGGEPLIMEEHYRILKLLDKKELYHVKLTYSTNFSKMKYKDQDVLELWNKFDKVQVGASLDGSYARGEYIRKGQKWEQVVKNRKRMLAACPDVHFFLTPTVSSLNVWHLPDFHQEWFDLGLIGPNEWTTNVLNYPSYLNIQALPFSYKQKVTIKYRQYLDTWTAQNQKSERTVNAFESIIRYMWEDNLINALPNFIEHTRTLDEIRNENLIDVFPELEEVIDR